MNSQATAVLTLVDHLIAADYALAQLSHAVADPPLLGGLHGQDLREWMEQLQARLDAVGYQ